MMLFLSIAFAGITSATAIDAVLGPRYVPGAHLLFANESSSNNSASATPTSWSEISGTQYNSTSSTTEFVTITVLVPHNTTSPPYPYPTSNSTHSHGSGSDLVTSTIFSTLTAPYANTTVTSLSTVYLNGSACSGTGGCSTVPPSTTTVTRNYTTTLCSDSTSTPDVSITYWTNTISPVPWYPIPSYNDEVLSYLTTHSVYSPISDDLYQTPTLPYIEQSSTPVYDWPLSSYPPSTPSYPYESAVDPIFSSFPSDLIDTATIILTATQTNVIEFTTDYSTTVVNSPLATPLISHETVTASPVESPDLINSPWAPLLPTDGELFTTTYESTQQYPDLTPAQTTISEFLGNGVQTHANLFVAAAAAVAAVAVFVMI